MSAHKNYKKVVAVLPAYNAARTLKATVDAIPKEWVDDIVLVDDASHDNTAEVARALGIKTIVHEKNTGYGGNQKTCYREALRMGADIAVMIHPDFQYDPYYIPELIRPLAFGKADISIGSRMMIKRNALKGGMPWWKFIANIGLTFIENIIFGFRLSEYHTGFRAYSRHFLEAVPFEKNSDDFVFDSEILAQARIAGASVYETPIETKYFKEASMIGFWRSVKYGFAILGVLGQYVLFRIGLIRPVAFEVSRVSEREKEEGGARSSSAGLFFLILLAVGFMLVYSFSALTTKPKFGVDESMTVDVAHNILRYGVFNISTAPGEFPPRPYTIVATGYAVTVPLAGVFSVWGFGLPQARIYMMVWMFVFLGSVCWIFWNLFGRTAAVAALFFIVTFATFYDIGRTAMGELPGLVFFMWGAYVLAYRMRWFLSGILLGLATATKPSLYLAVIPVLGVYTYLRRREFTVRPVLHLVAGVSVPILAWVFTVFPHPFSVGAWREATAFLQNPFGRPILANVMGNMHTLVTSTTLAYFYGIAVLVVWLYRHERYSMPSARREFMSLSLLLAMFGFIYFLRSPGWFRYLFASELLLLVLLYPALESLVVRARETHTFARFPSFTHIILAVLFVALQIVQLFFFSRILSSSAPQVVSAYINSDVVTKGGTVGIINNKQVAALIPAEYRYQQFQWTGTPLVGTNPLALGEERLPRLLFVAEKDGPVFVEPYKDTFAAHYALKQIFFKDQYLFERVR